jgi:hypothetical protein
MLAAKGISLGRIRGVPMHAEALPKGYVYPISPQEIKGYFEKAPKDEVKGLKRIAFVTPKDSQEKDAWARYVKSKREIRIFAQQEKDGKISGEDPKELNQHMNEYVLPHEMGHHIALRDLPTDKSLAMAEARADAHVVGMKVDDKDAKMFKVLHEEPKKRVHAAAMNETAERVREFGLIEARAGDAKDQRGTADLMVELARIDAKNRDDVHKAEYDKERKLENSHLLDVDKEVAVKRYKALFTTPVPDKDALERGYFMSR